MSRKLLIDQGWTLFLDRDGVVNERIQDDYVKHPDEFVFIEGVQKSLEILASHFNPIIIVTNQQGIGRGLMTNSQLKLVHDKMLRMVTETGGRIDAVFYSPELRNTHSFTRKPAVGLGLQARKQFPDINFKRSIMVGDSYTDILFGHRLGMRTVLIGTDKDTILKCVDMLDFSFPDLISFAEFIQQNLPGRV